MRKRFTGFFGLFVPRISHFEQPKFFQTKKSVNLVVFGHALEAHLGHLMSVRHANAEI